MDDYIGHDDLRHKLQADHRQRRDDPQDASQQAAEGPNTILGADDVKGADDPVLGGAHVLVADDEPNIRATISDVLRKYHAT